MRASRSSLRGLADARTSRSGLVFVMLNSFQHP
jgi:hypothetical protein